MRKLLTSISLLLVTLGLLGCSFFYSIFPTPTPAALPTQAAQRLPELTGDWHVRLAQTGGFAGVSRTLEISSNGEVTITEERINRKDITQLPADKLARLKELIAASEYRPVLQPLACNDCFIFDLQIENGSEKFKMQIDQINLSETGLEPLVGFLGEMLNSK
jgi:hypothetical protein